MTESNPNPLTKRIGALGKFEPGSDEAGRQLQDHCDRLNAMKGDKHWFVAGQKPNRYVSSQHRFSYGAT